MTHVLRVLPLRLREKRATSGANYRSNNHIYTILSPAAIELQQGAL